MYVLTTTQYTPYFFGLLMHRTHVTLGMFDTYNDACGWAFNVCGFATSAEFSVDYDEEAFIALANNTPVKDCCCHECQECAEDRYFIERWS